MQTFTFVATAAGTNTPLPGASVSVYQTGTTTFASLYNSSGSPITNPMTADVNGYAVFKVADGTYDIEASSGAYTAPERIQVEIFDLANFSAEIATLQGTVGNGTVGFLTLAALNADLNFGAGTIAQVFSDSTPSNNGTYLKSGISGSGSWSQVSTNTLSSLATAIAAETARAEAAEDAFLPSSGPTLTSIAAGVNAAPLADPDQRVNPYAYYSANGLARLAFDNVLYLFIVNGQSLGVGGVDTGSLIATSALYPGQVLMPNNAIGAGLRINGAVAAYANPFDDFTDSVEQVLAGSEFAELICTSAMNHVYGALNTALGATRAPRFAIFNVSIGDKAYYQLKQGAPSSVALLEGVEDVVRIAARAGMQVVVPGVLWVQGENDTAITQRGLYSRMLQQLQRQLWNDISRITGQTERLVLFYNQTNHVLSADAPYQRIQMAQLDADGLPDIRCVGPIYQYPMSTYSTPDLLIHKNNVGANHMGMAFSRAILAELFGTGWSPLKPQRIWFSSTTTIVIDCYVPVPPLVVDTSGSPISLSGMLTYRGFDLYDDTGTSLTSTISALSVVNIGGTLTNTGLQLTLTAPTSKFVTIGYAMRRDGPDSTTADGPITGARGCVRDSAAQTNLYDATTDNNWMMQWAADVQTLA